MYDAQSLPSSSNLTIFEEWSQSNEDSTVIDYSPISLESNKFGKRVKEIKLPAIPWVKRLPDPPGVICENLSIAQRQKILLEIFRHFLLKLHKGRFLRQMTSKQKFASIYCQLSDDMKTLIMNPQTGRVIEFPWQALKQTILLAYHKTMAQPSNNNEKENSEKENISQSKNMELKVNTEKTRIYYLVVFEFGVKKLVFVFHERHIAERFKLCVELLCCLLQMKETKPFFDQDNLVRLCCLVPLQSCTCMCNILALPINATFYLFNRLLHLLDSTCWDLNKLGDAAGSEDDRKDSFSDFSDASY